MNNPKSNTLIAWNLLYYAYGILPIIAGLDKCFGYLADWNIYLNPDIPAVFNVHPAVFMHMISVAEIILGIIVLLKPRIGGYLAAAWLIGISINLISMGQHSHGNHEHTMGHYDIALRDIALAIGAYAFALISKDLDK